MKKKIEKTMSDDANYLHRTCLYPKIEFNITNVLNATHNKHGQLLSNTINMFETNNKNTHKLFICRLFSNGLMHGRRSIAKLIIKLH